MSSESEEDEASIGLKVEIQKLLAVINEDTIKLKNELSAVHALVEENASLPATVKMTNEKLIIAAKEAGIDLEDLETLLVPNSVDNDSEEESQTNQKSKSKGKSAKFKNAAGMAAATEELTEKMKRTFKKK